MALHRLLENTLVVTAAFVLVIQIGPATAGADLCIRCAQPEDTYVCRIRSEADISDGQQLFCIMNIAQQYGHASCTSTQQKDCSGRLVEYDLPQPLPGEMRLRDAAAEHEDEKAGSASVKGDDTTPVAKKEPKTLIEFTKQTATATKNSLDSVGEKTGEVLSSSGQKVGIFTKSIGEGIKNTTQKTFKCVTSLFTKCGE